MKEGDMAEIDALNITDVALKRRLESFGICKSCTLCVKRFGLFKSTVQVQVNNTLVALRKDEALSIDVHKVA
jgi:Fe2+ transport system protein FeoA